MRPTGTVPSRHLLFLPPAASSHAAHPSRGDFVFTSNRIIRLLVEEGLNNLPVVSKEIFTPLGDKFTGVGFQVRRASGLGRRVLESDR